MSIKPHTNSKVKNVINRVVQDLGACTGYADLPKEIQEKIKTLKEEIKNFDLSYLKNEVKTLTGNIATEQEILDIIKEQSGYTKWTVENPHEEYDDYLLEVEDLKEYYGVEFDASLAKEYFVSRNVKSRDELHLIRVTVLPGYFSVGYDTGRVGWAEDNLLNLKEFKSAISSVFD